MKKAIRSQKKWDIRMRTTSAMYSKRNSVFLLPNTELPENKRTESRKSKDRKSKIEKGVQQVEKREQVKGKIHER